ncbi:hypothetical protein G7043_47155 [Lentzea sp. NEAU-D13]|uniref:Uncharacterized protein n=1 Tax=Lentzea alba TaxID=2714351 RepID=A0A7C9RYN5_9PSEU|nr:hypothetical protein [Lentzea alba]NGY66485.1 hypothetical protein [Lentzea alba]
MPCILPPDEQQWFDRWAAREGRKHAVKITMWNGVELRRQLMQPDAANVYRIHFTGNGAQPAEQVRMLADVSGLGDALFVRQLEEAGNVETDAARGLFFAAEALARDLASAGNEVGVNALNELHLDVQSLWEQHFNARVAAADDEGRMQGLVDQVLLEAGQWCDPEGLKLRPAHSKGVVHRLVEDARAGWVRHWRHIAAAHQGPAASDTIAAQLEADPSAGLRLWERVQQAEDNADRLEGHAKRLRAERRESAARPDRAAVIRRLSHRFGEVLSDLGYPKLSDPRLDNNLMPHVRGLPYTAASSGGLVLISLAWYLAIWEVAHEQDGRRPGLLIIDSPQKNLGHSADPDDPDFADTGLVENFYRHVKQWLAGPGVGAQLVVVDNSPPEAVAGDIVVRYTRSRTLPPYGLIDDAFD